MESLLGGPMLQTFDSSMFWGAWRFHWISLFLGGLGCLLTGLRLCRPVSWQAPKLPSALPIFWFAITLWAFQTNLLIYEYSENPHWTEKLVGLLVSSQEILGSIAVLGALLVTRHVNIVLLELFKADRSMPQNESRNRCLEASILSVVVIQVMLNWFIMELGCF